MGTLDEAGRSAPGPKAQPFARRDRNLTTWGRLRTALALVTLVPVRAALALGIMGSGAAMWSLAAVGVPRSLLRAATRRMARALLLVCGFWQIEEVNSLRHRSPGATAPLVVVANHVSYLEIVYFLASDLCPSFMMKKTCIKVPLVGYIAQEMGAVVTDRGEDSRQGRGGATAALVRHVDRLAESADPSPILVFPEGTTSNGSCLLTFHTGAFVPGVAVQPVVVEFPFEGDQFSCAYESVSTPAHIVRVLGQWSHRMRVVYLDPYEPDAREAADPALFARNVRAYMAEQAKLDMVDQSYEDKLKYHTWLRTHYARLGPASLYLYVRPDLVGDAGHVEDKAESGKKRR